jgi:hypothetical protein
MEDPEKILSIGTIADSSREFPVATLAGTQLPLQPQVCSRGFKVQELSKHMVRIILPFHLRNLAQTGAEVQIEVEGPATQRSVLDALEARYPMLRGTIREHGTQQRRAFLRFFACQEDLSHESPDTPLPDAVASGVEPLVIIGAIAGG